MSTPENATTILGLDPSAPADADFVSFGAAHMRLIKQVLTVLFPVGSIIENTSGTNPGTYIGGTWSKMEGGRVTVSEGDGYTAGQTGGASTHTLTSGEMPSHTHAINPPATTTTTNGDHFHEVGPYLAQLGADGGGYNFQNSGSGVYYTKTAGAHTHTVDIAQFNSASTGSGNAHNNMQPYLVVYRWERTA